MICFDLNQATSYFLDGKLETWLSDRYYDEAVEQIGSLQKEDPELQQKLCQILGVKYEADSMTPEEIEARNRKLAKLKEITDDEEILANVDQVAFSQEELSDLLDEGVDKIYLCGKDFKIPERMKNKTYIGINTKLSVSPEKKKRYRKNHIQLIDLLEETENDFSIEKEVGIEKGREGQVNNYSGPLTRALKCAQTALNCDQGGPETRNNQVKKKILEVLQKYGDKKYQIWVRPFIYEKAERLYYKGQFKSKSAAKREAEGKLKKA